MTHRNHFILLALLRQVPDSADKVLVRGDVGFACFNHPTAELYQLPKERGVSGQAADHIKLNDN